MLGRDYPHDAKRKIVSLIETLEMLTTRDPEQEVVVVRTPRVDAYRVRQASDRNYDVFTVRKGRIVALRACRDRDEALAVAGVE